MAFLDPALFSPDAPYLGLTSPARAQSQPVPGLAHGSIPGLLGVAVERGDFPRTQTFEGEQILPGRRRDLPPTVASTRSRSGVFRPGESQDAILPPSEPIPLGGITNPGMGELPQPQGNPGIPLGLMSGMVPSTSAVNRSSPNADAGQSAPPLPAAINVGPTPGGGRAYPGSQREPVTTDPAALPQNSTPATDIPPQFMGASSSAAPPPPARSAVPEGSIIDRFFKGIGDWRDANRLTLLAMAGGLAGAPSFGTGLQRAFTNAVPAQRFDIAQQQQNMTAQALINRGMPPDVAHAAATNPAILQQIIPHMFGPKQLQFTQIGEDMLGNKQYGFVDPVSRKVYDRAGNEITGGAGGAGSLGIGNVPVSPTTGMPMQGQELLAHLERTDPITAAGVKGVIAGDENAAGRNLQKLLPLAKLVDPTFTQQTYQTRLGLWKAYTFGKQFNEMQAINTVSGHLVDLARVADKLQNFGNLGPLNLPANYLVGKYRELSQDPRLTDFNTVKQAVSNELSKAYRGGHVTEGDVREWQQNINAVQTPEQLRTVIGRLNELLASKRQSLEDGWLAGTTSRQMPNEFRAESDRARDRFNAVANWSLGNGPAPSPSLGVRGQAGAAPAAAQPATPSAPAIHSKADYDKLPSDTTFVGQDGKTYRKP